MPEHPARASLNSLNSSQTCLKFDEDRFYKGSQCNQFQPLASFKMNLFKFLPAACLALAALSISAPTQASAASTTCSFLGFKVACVTPAKVRASEDSDSNKFNMQLRAEAKDRAIANESAAASEREESEKASERSEKADRLSAKAAKAQRKAEKLAKRASKKAEAAEKAAKKAEKKAANAAKKQARAEKKPTEKRIAAAEKAAKNAEKAANRADKVQANAEKVSQKAEKAAKRAEKLENRAEKAAEAVEAPTIESESES
ncbi:MAG: hypothetical protein KJO30_00865 [Boseongicola sp.]|nr:hypothetical protein [Boseongicola sp.]